MVYENQYRAKLTDSDTAVEQINSNSIVAISQAASQPPALMQALANRAEAGKVDNVKLYYFHAERHMKNSLLRYELMGRIKPYCMFIQDAERELIKKGVGGQTRTQIENLLRLRSSVPILDSKSCECRLLWKGDSALIWLQGRVWVGWCVSEAQGSLCHHRGDGMLKSLDCVTAVYVGRRASNGLRNFGFLRSASLI